MWCVAKLMALMLSKIIHLISSLLRFKNKCENLTQYRKSFYGENEQSKFYHLGYKLTSLC